MSCIQSRRTSELRSRTVIGAYNLTNPRTDPNDYGLIWLLACMLEHKFCAAKIPARASYAQTRNWKKEAYQCYYFAAVVDRKSGSKYGTLLDEVGPVTQRCWQAMIKGLDLKSWAVKPDLELPEPIALAVWSGIIHVAERQVTRANLSEICSHREPFPRLALSFGTRENEAASLDPRVVKFLLDCESFGVQSGNTTTFAII
jgi:hypothetical protein